ncbi:MAG: trypsin-like peptidase domain-containing protein [Desulfovibrionaceae bacterium]|nr:trypsin-like peptidase domain-containing protein [Desulfovibrionaceae bacterium]
MALRLFGCVLLLVCLARLSGSPGEAFAQDQGVLGNLQADLNRVVARIKPSVVCVKAQKRQVFQGGGEMWFESIGSGIVVDGRGYILTNSHVVKGGEKIMVGFWTQGKSEFAAAVVDEDPAADLALLRVDAPLPLIPAVFGNSGDLRLGDYIVSVGSPYGFEHSATFGVVSGLHRDLMIGGAAFTDMIQTDATINQGNSGGPLLTLSGEVAGVSVAIYSPDKAYTGVGFAIPADRARQFVSRPPASRPGRCWV